ncbi:MAG: beta-N-acetylhexosaminidase [Candidatus Symbiothrix sp.]|jgi:hexosaminidase|nr:beta-N-acetylhexosaminidase [Candidatus Symbiothrix sp.]
MKTVKQLVLIFALSFAALSAGAQKNEYAIIPGPLHLRAQSGQFEFDGNTAGIYFESELDAASEQAFFILTERLQNAAGIRLERVSNARNADIVCVWNTKLEKPESYKLNVAKNKITIEAHDAAGFFYAAQTLRQLLPVEIENQTVQTGVRWAVPCCQIFDAPQYAYRGMHLDVSRHFSTKEEVMLYIDQLAFLKINTFHWHLTDDQGWRIEIKKYPKLTKVGAWRFRTLDGAFVSAPNRKWKLEKHGGFYTQDEVKEVVAYAKKRHINVLPEIEMPGHAVAALAAYPEFSCSGGPFEVEGLWGVFNDVYCTREETFTFLKDILDEIIPLFPYSYIHIGGDECPKVRWERCAACQKRMADEGIKDTHALQSYFIGRIGHYLGTKGKKIIGWDEILEGGLAAGATVMSWRGTEGGIAAAKMGHNVIMTPNAYMYLDQYQSEAKENEPRAIGGYLPIEKVYNYNPLPSELTAEQSKFILGVQGNVWTEYMINQDIREFRIFPRIDAVAENGWLPQNKKNYPDFKRRLEQITKRYDIMGINYSKAFITNPAK